MLCSRTKLWGRKPKLAGSAGALWEFNLIRSYRFTSSALCAMKNPWVFAKIFTSLGLIEIFVSLPSSPPFISIASSKSFSLMKHSLLKMRKESKWVSANFNCNSWKCLIGSDVEWHAQQCEMHFQANNAHAHWIKFWLLCVFGSFWFCRLRNKKKSFSGMVCRNGFPFWCWWWETVQLKFANQRKVVWRWVQVMDELFSVIEVLGVGVRALLVLATVIAL